MQTPFTPHFKHASIPLTQVSRQPFEPLYSMPFVTAGCTEYWVGGSCQFIYRWHDGFDVFVATLEARIANPTHIVPHLPVESLLSDLHLVYQLAGNSGFAGLVLAAQEHLLVYASPARARLRIEAHPQTGCYATAAVVPKSSWVTRNPTDPGNPLTELIQCLVTQPTEHRALPAAATPPTAAAWVDLLLTTPPESGMLLDDALNHPVVNLMETHLANCRTQQRLADDKQRQYALVAAARLMASEHVARMTGGNLPALAYIAATLHTTPAEIRKLHYRHHRRKFSQYLIDCRMAEAQKRLRLGHTIASVAFALGWVDEPHFINQFKKYTGTTPGNFPAK